METKNKLYLNPLTPKNLRPCYVIHWLQQCQTKQKHFFNVCLRKAVNQTPKIPSELPKISSKKFTLRDIVFLEFFFFRFVQKNKMALPSLWGILQSHILSIVTADFSVKSQQGELLCVELKSLFNYQQFFNYCSVLTFSAITACVDNYCLEKTQQIKALALIFLGNFPQCKRQQIRF